MLITACIFMHNAQLKAAVPEIYEIPGIIIKKLKKPPQAPPPYMVQTYDEWLETARDIELDKRLYRVPKPEINEKLNKVEDPVILISRYNSPPGSNEVDLSAIKKATTLKSVPVASPDFNNLAVSVYYYSPAHNQISSEVLVVPLDTSKSRINRILEAKILDFQKGSNLSSGIYDVLENLYSSLTVVDWSADGRAILVKEKIGSTDSGIFRTNVWAIFLNEESGYDYKEYPSLQKTIIKYWKKNGKIILDSHRWDIKVLGFNSEKPNQALVIAYVYDNNSEKIFLGVWGLDIYSDSVELISLENVPQGIATNGMTLRFRTE